MRTTAVNTINLMPCGTTATTVLDTLRPFESSRGARQAVRIRNAWRWLDPSPSVLHHFVVFHRRDFPDLQKELVKNVRSHMKLLILSEDVLNEPMEWIVPDLMELGIRKAKRIHVARLSDEDAERYMRRFTRALAYPDDAIIDTGWKGDTLVVVAPLFERLEVPLEKLPAKVRQARRRDRENIELDEYGEFLYWPDLDIHMGWSQFMQAVDADAKMEAELRSEEFDERYGEAIRKLRVETELNQTGIPGLHERTVRRIEQGKTRITVNAIRKLAKAHKITPAEYMQALAERL